MVDYASDGLPASCGNDYAVVHQRWRSESRLLFLCSESSAIGAYLKAVKTAFFWSLRTRRALMLGCGDEHAGEAAAKLLALYFRGVDGIDWRPHPLQYNRSVSVRAAKYAKPVGNTTHVLGTTVGDESISLHIDEHSASPPDDSEAVGMRARSATYHCILRALLVPTRSLEALVPAPLRLHRMNYSALHVRLGDGNMAWQNAAHHPTQRIFLHEQRALDPGFSRHDFGGPLGCFAGALSHPHLIVSDTESVLAAAERQGMVTTVAIGRPVHFGMNRHTYGARDAAKVLLDWYLLARARAVASAGFKPVDVHMSPWTSSYLQTAREWHEQHPAAPYRLGCPSATVGKPSSSPPLAAAAASEGSEGSWLSLKEQYRAQGADSVLIPCAPVHCAARPPPASPATSLATSPGAPRVNGGAWAERTGQ
jgi:hypothetical protein